MLVNNVVRQVTSKPLKRSVEAGAGEAPKLLLISVLPYFLCPQLVREFQRVGFRVEVTAARQHPVYSLKCPPVIHDLGVMSSVSVGPWGARANIRRSIIRSRPDLVVPCDDLAGRLLRQIGGTASGRLRDVIERSLGPVSSYRILDSRSEQVALARRSGVRTPSSLAVRDRADLVGALDTIGLPAFLKRDGTWAGEGVAEIDRPDDLAAIWARISRAHSLPTTLRHVSHTGWRYALTNARLRRPSIQLQAAVSGQPANCAVLCKDGEILASISAVALETTSATGPASIVRVIEHAEIADIAAKLVQSLGGNGFFGMDFILSDSGDVFFLEINARPTPIALLPVATSPDLIARLFEIITGTPAAPRDPITRDLIALFPQELSRDANSPYFARAHHYLPADETELIAAATSDDRHGRAAAINRPSRDRAARNFQPVPEMLHPSP